MKKLTKEEKKKIKKQKEEINKEINKLNRSSKILLAFIVTILVMMFINNFIMYFNEDYALFFIKHITNNFNGILFFVSSYINNLSIYLTFILFGICVICAILDIVISISKASIERKNKRINFLNKLLYICIFFVGYFIINNCYYLHLPNFDTLYFADTKNKSYTKEDLIDLNKYLANKVLEYAGMMERDNGSVVFDGDLNEQVIKDLHNIDDEFTLLKGTYPKYSSNLSESLKGIFGSSTYGLTHFYSTYFDYSMDNVLILNTIAHEYVHTKGITRENETVFASSLAGIKSDNIVSNYSGYLEAFNRTNYALYEMDAKISNDIEDEIVSSCLTKNYNELCELYTKNNGEYISGAKKLYISSYYLKNYIGFEQELKESLSILMDGKGVLTINNKEVTIDEVIKLITTDSKEKFYYERDLDKKTYNELKSAIKNGRLYKSIYQENSPRKNSEDKKDLNKYYLEPFTNYDYPILSQRVASIDYTYERSTRLFLEYFDKIGYAN